MLVGANPCIRPWADTLVYPYATTPRFVREFLRVLSRRLSLQEGKDKGVATLTASADSSIFLRVSAELALPLGRNRHLVNSPTVVIATPQTVRGRWALSSDEAIFWSAERDCFAALAM